MGLKINHGLYITGADGVGAMHLLQVPPLQGSHGMTGGLVVHGDKAKVTDLRTIEVVVEVEEDVGRLPNANTTFVLNAYTFVTSHANNPHDDNFWKKILQNG